MRAATRQMHLGVFVLGTGNHSAGWRYDGAAISNNDLSVTTEIARIAERGKFDLMFVADAVAVRDGRLAALSRWPQYMAYFDPLTLLPALAAVTTHIGLCATATTSNTSPITSPASSPRSTISAAGAPDGTW